MPNMSKYCAVVGCMNIFPNVTLHCFPRKDKEEDRYRIWMDILTKAGNARFCPSSSYSRICNAHFEESCFDSRLPKQLKKDAIPTIMPWGTIILPKPARENTSSSSTETVIEIPIPVPKKVITPSICGNCSCSLKDDESSTAQKYVIKYAGVKDENDLDLYVKDALAYVLGISWNGFCKELEIINESMFINDFLHDDTSGEKGVAFCRQCASYLYHNYTAQKNFERLTKSGSIVEQAKLFKKNRTHQDVKTEVLEEAESESVLCPVNEEPLDVKWEDNDFILSGGTTSNGIQVTSCTLKLFEKDSSNNVNHSENYTCVHCCETFISKEGWLTHSLNHSDKLDDEKITTCAICGVTCKSVIHYKYLHKPLHQKKGKRWKCKICTKKFRSKLSLKSHLLEGHQQKVKSREGTKCEVCRILVYARGKKIMEAHMAEHAAAGVWYECNICHEKLPSGIQLRRHKTVHQLKEPMFCKVCCRPFYFESHLINHEARHNEVRNLECNLCDKKFSRKEHLKSHLQNKHGERKNLKCQTCGKIYKNEVSLSRHQRLHDENDKEVMCDVCGKIYKHRRSLAYHKLKVHLRIKRYACSFCGQKLSGPRMLKHHENLHLTDPNFKGRPRKLKNPNKTFIVNPNRTIVKHPKNNIHRPAHVPVEHDSSDPADSDEESFLPNKAKHTYDKKVIKLAVDNSSQPQIQEPSCPAETSPAVPIKPSFKRRFISNSRNNL